VPSGAATAPTAAPDDQGVLILVDPATGEALGAGIDAATVAKRRHQAFWSCR
jgi:hypothetical protein